MELTTDQQIFEQIKKSTKILIFLPETLNADNLASALAFKGFLNKLQKDVTVVSSGKFPDNLKFLPGSGEIVSALSLGRSFVISVDTMEKKVDEISYHTSADKVHIYLKSKKHEFTKDDLSFSSEKFPADLIITIDCKSLDSLGKTYEQQADLIFETPKINIDNKSENEYYGAINLVDLSATSIAEILADLLQKYEQQLIDEDLATCLLTGIISKTNSFQHVHTTPKAFIKASELVSLGGRQQEVIKNIFKTKSISLLKLWGRALARMKILEEQKAIYSILNLGDFEKAESGEGEVLPVLKEFLDSISGYRIVMLISESTKDDLSLTLAAHEQIPAEKILELFGTEGKILDFNLGHYKILQIKDKTASLEILENKFLEILTKI